MKKKIVALSLIIILLFGGVVGASSVNGDYKGNAIVNVIVNANKIKSDVPAILYDGSTLIPLRAAVEALGATVSWDNSTNTATITSASTLTTRTADQIATDAKSHNIEFLTYNVSNNGISMLVFYYNKNLQDTNNNSDYTFMLNQCALSSAMYCKMNDAFGLEVSASVQDIIEFSKGNLSSDEFTKKMTIKSSQEPPLINDNNIGTSSLSIETNIEGDFNGWDGETIFKLANGQIWQQTEYNYTYHYAYRPKVLIYKSGTGYKMKVDGVDKAIGVKQLK